jgi:hypothetical protein
MKRFIAAALAVGSLVSSAPTFAADDAGAFDKWLSADAPECVPVSAIKSVATLTDLTPEQFQFVRALYIAIPPISRKLPPGDHAIMASSGGAVMVALVAGGQTWCAISRPRFHPGNAGAGWRGNDCRVGRADMTAASRFDAPLGRLIS